MKYGDKGETGEKEPKHAKASDSSGERRHETPKENRTTEHRGESGEKIPKAAETADHDRPSHHFGKHDGRLGELNDGNRGEREVYSHKRHN